MDKLRDELQAALRDALQTYEKNRDSGSAPQAIAYDSGRYAGLKQAVEILDRLQDPRPQSANTGH